MGTLCVSGVVSLDVIDADIGKSCAVHSPILAVY